MYGIQHDRGDVLPTDAGLPSPLAVMHEDRAAIGRELAAFNRGWGSADSEATTRLALLHAAERLIEVRAKQGQAHDGYLALHADLEDRVKAGVFPLPAGAAHAQPWALAKMFLQVARFAWAKHCEREARVRGVEPMLVDERDELLEVALAGSRRAVEQVTADADAAERAAADRAHAAAEQGVAA